MLRLLFGQSGIETGLIALVLEAGDDRRLGKIFLIRSLGLRNRLTVATQRTLRDRVALDLFLLLLVLVVELRLSRVDDLLCVRTFVILDLGRSNRLRRIGG